MIECLILFHFKCMYGVPSRLTWYIPVQSGIYSPSLDLCSSKHHYNYMQPKEYIENRELRNTGIVFGFCECVEIFVQCPQTSIKMLYRIIAVAYEYVLRYFHIY